MPPGKSNTRCACPQVRLTAHRRSEGRAGLLRRQRRQAESLSLPRPRATFINLTSLEKMTIGHKIADAVVILGAVDIVLGEVDR